MGTEDIMAIIMYSISRAETRMQLNVTCLRNML